MVQKITKMKPTIRPHNCASLWIVDSTLFVELPKGDLTHTISVPATVEGLSKVVRLLSHRTESSRIGELGEPTQHHINKPIEVKVKRVKAKFTEGQLDNTKEVLRKLGMI